MLVRKPLILGRGLKLIGKGIISLTVVKVRKPLILGRGLKPSCFNLSRPFKESEKTTNPRKGIETPVV